MVTSRKIKSYRLGNACALVAALSLAQPVLSQGLLSGRNIQVAQNLTVQLQRIQDGVERKAIGQVLAARNSFTDSDTYKRVHTPDFANNLKDQTPIKNQGGRETCTYFAATAAVEAAYKKAGFGDLNLSEQHLIWLRNVTMLTDDKASDKPLALTDVRAHENQLGSLGGGSAVYNLQLMTKYGVGLASNCPYIGGTDYENTKSAYYNGFGLSGYSWDNPKFPQLPIDAWNMAQKQVPTAIQDGTLYGVQRYVSLNEKQYKDPFCIEYLISKGFNVAINITMYEDPAMPGRPIWTRNAKLNDKVNGGHAVLIVGYDRRRHFFVVKNSWGPMRYNAATLAPDLKDVATKYDGYYLMDYNYLTGAEGAGYVVSVTKPGSGIFERQSLLGGWKLTVTNKQTGAQVFLGRLTWRHLPGTDVNLSGKDLRVGDLYGKPEGGKDSLFRVNAVIGSELSLFIDFDHPDRGLSDRAGLRFAGRLGKSGDRMAVQNGMVAGAGSLGGVPASNLAFNLVRG